MSDQSNADGQRWEHRLDVLLADGVSGFRCPLCGDDVEATLDDLASYDRVKGHLLAHDPTLLAGALVEARSWARHGYEIAQESCSWTADSDEPTWMTDQYHAPCAACGWRNGAHADGCAAVGPDEYVIEDGSRTMRRARADDYAAGTPVTGDAKGEEMTDLLTALRKSIEAAGGGGS